MLAVVVYLASTTAGTKYVQIKWVIGNVLSSGITAAKCLAAFPVYDT